jgi:hypothetical protein
MRVTAYGRGSFRSQSNAGHVFWVGLNTVFEKREPGLNSSSQFRVLRCGHVLESPAYFDCHRCGRDRTASLHKRKGAQLEPV